MRNCELQRRLLSETLNPAYALNQAIIDEVGRYNQLKIKNMTTAKNNKIGRVYKTLISKKETKSEYRKV